MVVWTLARKDLRLLARDPRAMIILLVMPLVFILVLGVSLGEGFGKKAAENLRVSVLVLDKGLPEQHSFPPGGWSAMALRDLGETASITVELIESREQAQELVRTGRRPAVLILGPEFSNRIENCSFLAKGTRETLMTVVAALPGDPVALALAGLHQDTQNALPLYLADGINPFYRDGVNFTALDVEVLRDPTQATAAAIIDQVAQGSLLRIVMPWMIGRAFEKIGDPAFLTLLQKDKDLPNEVKIFLSFSSEANKRKLSAGLQNSIQNLFPKYNLTAKSWAALTRASDESRPGAPRTPFEEEGSGLLKRGAMRYQLLVPSYLVMFAFFLVLTVGWLFVAERRLGTMKRLVAAPLARWQIVLGKLLPCLCVSLFQGFFLLLAGRLLFDMSWGPDPLWLVPVVAATSLAAMGLAMLVAALARTETQVAIYGTLLVLVLAGLSGALMGDRSLMPEQMQRISLVTPHAWALDAYRQLLTSPTPNLTLVAESCLALSGFGILFLLLAWWFLKLEG